MATRTRAEVLEGVSKYRHRLKYIPEKFRGDWEIVLAPQ